MFIYCICTQYLVGAPFPLITASIWRGMEVISLWHCWGGMEAQVSLTVAFSSSANSPDLNPIENLWGIVKRKMRNKRPKKCRWAEGHCQRNLGFHTTSAVPQTDHLHATPKRTKDHATPKRTKDLNYYLFNTRVSQFELNYWNKWTFPQHSNLLRCTCICANES